MDWRTLFLSPEGRMGQKDFWIGFLILFVIWLLSPILHVLALLVWLALLYAWICLFAKRLHDMGKSAWLMLLPFGVAVIAGCLALVLGGVSAVSAIWAAAQGGFEPASWTAFFGALGAMVAFLGIAGLVKLVFILWVGLSRGDAGPNRWGPPPGSLTSPAASSAG
jgi:uncharacterized membrane protein YhaH (DUF805 family)